MRLALRLVLASVAILCTLLLFLVTKLHSASSEWLRTNLLPGWKNLVGVAKNVRCFFSAFHFHLTDVRLQGKDVHGQQREVVPGEAGEDQEDVQPAPGRRQANDIQLLYYTKKCVV